MCVLGGGGCGPTLQMPTAIAHAARGMCVAARMLVLRCADCAMAAGLTTGMLVVGLDASRLPPARTLASSLGRLPAPCARKRAQTRQIPTYPADGSWLAGSITGMLCAAMAWHGMGEEASAGCIECVGHGRRPGGSGAPCAGQAYL